MALRDHIEALRDADQVSAAAIAGLSGLAMGEVDEAAEAWAQAPPPRRRHVVERMVEMAEANVDLEFDAFLCHAMADSDPAVRERAAAGLWETTDRRVALRLLDALRDDPSAAVRAAAARSLGHFALLAETGKLLERDREAVYEALAARLREDAEPGEVRRRALEALGVFDTPEVEEWIARAYHSGDAPLRQSALFAMGRSCNARWLPSIFEEMESDDPAMRYEAANAAREQGDPAAAPRLVHLLSDYDAQVRMAAVQALGGVGGPSALRALREAAESDDAALREAAQEAIAAANASDDPFSVDGAR